MPVKLTAVLLWFACIVGCSMIPEYQQPELPVSDRWPGGPAYNDIDEAESPEDVFWKDYFKSETLRAIITRTLENNRDLSIALLNIDRARALYRIEESNRLPVVGAAGSFSRVGTPEDMSATRQSVTSSALSANVGMTAYELDFFGRVKSLNQEALENYLATKEAFYNTRIILISQVAQAYLSYLADKELLVLAQNTYETQKQTYEVIEQQFGIGDSTRLDMTRALMSVETAKVAIVQYTRRSAQAKNALTLLAGTPVDDLVIGIESLDSISFIENLPAGVPSETLTARPDIREAEHLLKAANADIGAARAALYPSIQLTSSFGLASTGLSSLFESGAAYAWNFTPSISIPIFNRGGLKANLEAAEIDEKIAVVKYEKVVQQAFREVSDLLADRGTYKDQMAAQNALVEASQKAYELSNIRYTNGIDDFLVLLDSQRALFEAEQRAVTTRLGYLSNLIAIYKVLGGNHI